MREALTAFRYRNFAIFWTGALLSSTGTWVQWVTVPYVIFELTDSAFLVGFTGFLQFVPAVLVGPLAGSIADRFHRRSVLLATQVAQASVAVVLWAVWAAGVRNVAVIVAIVAVGGFVAGVNIPSWQAFVSELVPRSVLLNAVTLNSTQFNAARAFGPALGGVVLATGGPSVAFLVNALSFVAVIAALALIRVPRLERASAHHGVLREFADAVRYVRGRPGIAASFLIVLALGALGGPLFSLLAIFAERVFGVTDTLYGLMGASLGIGALLGAPLIAGRGQGVSRARLITFAVTAYGAALVGFALAPWYALGVASLMVAGAGYLAIASTLNTTIQLQVDETMRGKVLAAYLMCLTAAIPVGSLLQGAAAEAIGARATVALAGALMLVWFWWLRTGTTMVAAMDEASATARAATVSGAGTSERDGPGEASPAPVSAPVQGSSSSVASHARPSSQSL